MIGAGKFTFSLAYTSKKNSGNVAYTFAIVPYTPMAVQEIHPSFGVYVKRMMAVDIHQDYLDNSASPPTIPLLLPKPGDFFVGPDSFTYNVTHCQSRSIFYNRVVGLCPQISYDLQDLMTWNKRGGAALLSGYRQVSTVTSTPNIACRVQPTNNRIEDMFGKRGMLQIYNVWAAPYAIGFGDQLVQTNVSPNIILEPFDIDEQYQLEFLTQYKCVVKF